MHEKPIASLEEHTKAYDQEGLQEFMDHSRAVGEWHTAVIQTIVGWRKAELPSLDTVPDSLKLQLETIYATMQAYFTDQAKRFKEHPVSAHDLLLQAVKTEQQLQLISDTSKYELTEFSPGVYGILLDIDLYAQLKLVSSAEAIAFSFLPPKISFIVYRRTNRTALDSQHQATNIPHEVHHLAWKAALRAKLIPSSESHPLRVIGFWNFVDEAIATLAGNQTPKGYPTIEAESQEWKQFILDNPEIVTSYEDDVKRLNTTLDSLDKALVSNAKFKRSDFVYSFITATTFKEIEENIEKIIHYYNIDIQQLISND